MRSTKLFLAVLMLGCITSVTLADAILPPAYANINGATGLNTPVRNYGRTYQFVVPGSDLVGAGGNSILGINWRSFANTSSNPGSVWPANDITWANWDAYIGELNGSLGASLSLTFADNVVAGTDTMVRSGPFTLPAGSYAHSNPAGGPDPWCTAPVMFDTPYVFDTSKNYVITFRHTDNSETATPWFEDCNSSSGAYQAVAVGSGTGNDGYTATVGTGIASYLVTQLIIPEPSSLMLLLLAAPMLRRR